MLNYEDSRRQQQRKFSLLALGECMLELTPLTQNSLSKSYAGDTFNALIYAKRLNPKIEVALLSAVGSDAMSNDMLAFWQKHQVDAEHALQSESKTIGIYAITTDNAGERSFSYWRKDSAASQLMAMESTDKLAQRANGYDLVFFSGIGLAILSDDDKALFVEMIGKMKKLGCKIAFDPNYREKMWGSTAQESRAKAIYWLEKAYALSDILLPGIEEHQQLFGHEDQKQIVDYCQLFGSKEVIIKCDADGVFGYAKGKLVHHQPFQPAPKQVDSTAAGDSFAGSYLSARIIGESIEKSIRQACFVARNVVQHKGAIMTDECYLESVTSKLLEV